MKVSTVDIQGRDRSGADGAKRIRQALGQTQVELAGVLGISTKAVQSYEQGWRVVPARMLIQMMVLLALYRKQSMEEIPCWKIQKCVAVARKRCPSYTLGNGQFCWFIGSKECASAQKPGVKAILSCLRCPVVQRLLQGPAVQEK